MGKYFTWFHNIKFFFNFFYSKLLGKSLRVGSKYITIIGGGEIDAMLGQAKILL